MCGGIRYPEVSDYRPQPLGYSYVRFPVLRTIAGGAPFRGYRCAKPSVIALVKPRRAKGSYAALSRASHAFALEKVLSDTNNLKRKSASKHV